jgi:hypothetical protein
MTVGDMSQLLEMWMTKRVSRDLKALMEELT